MSFRQYPEDDERQEEEVIVQNEIGRSVAKKLRAIASTLGGEESGDGLFLCGLSDAIEHGDAMDELAGMTISIIPK